jgi:hypothetical protein
MKLLIQSSGAVIVLAALIDIYLTVLYARSGTGLINPFLNKGVWRLFRRTALLFGGTRGRLLSYCGPTLLVLTTAIWSLLLISGFALIVWPQLGTAIQSSQGQTPTDFISALYYSAFSFTTLGTGDLIPQSGLSRLLMVIEAALGFSFFTLTITYFISVYSALRQRNTFALTLHHKTDRTANGVHFISSLGAGGSFEGARQEFAAIAQGISDLLESHHFYPVLHYFHFNEVRYALPRIVFITMDSVSLIQTVLAEEKSQHLVHSSAVKELWSSGRDLLNFFQEDFSPQGLPAQEDFMTEDFRRQWRNRYQNASEHLISNGIETRSDATAGADLYIDLCREWYPYVVSFSDSALYDLREVIPFDFSQ